MPTDYDFHGTHPVSPRPDAVRVKWIEVQPSLSPARVRRYTCECRPLMFEDCRAGGQAFIRRYDRSVVPWAIAESPRVKIREAEILWRQLMAGQAR
ncbi:hypothetical protein [Nonomuraea wenchangensis]|uniref:Uncharacterized protein n=1 Tax=Nonomuraea wenchangensis TaxID=568860 RepID=A0A1I0L337_9ACTN|nr:hypothetical protein [Nonomuraea wenchangensis]SEU33147.1 hypothetical protein SAMN05421811_111127 [Nonomuraea wenchangensis]